jgi:hypothetical protein
MGAADLRRAHGLQRGQDRHCCDAARPAADQTGRLGAAASLRYRSLTARSHLISPDASPGSRRGRLRKGAQERRGGLADGRRMPPPPHRCSAKHRLPPGSRAGLLLRHRPRRTQAADLGRRSAWRQWQKDQRSAANDGNWQKKIGTAHGREQQIEDPPPTM